MSKRRLLRNFPFVLMAYIALKPLYLFESGNMQICDFFLLFFIIFDFFRQRVVFRLKNEKIILYLILFVLYSTIVNLLYYSEYPDIRLVQSVIFNIYNSIAFFYFISLGLYYKKKGISSSMSYGILMSLSVCILGLFLLGVSGRNAGFFNNPNQLGLHSIMMIVLLVYTDDEFHAIGKILVVILAIIAAIASVSKAAMISLAFSLPLYLFYLNRSGKISNISLAGVIAVIVILISFVSVKYSDELGSLEAITYAQERLSNMGEEDDSDLSTGRGFARVGEMKENFMIGMGEGAYNRFKIMRNHEIHSTFVSTFVSYGLLGSCLLLFVGLNLFYNKEKLLRNGIMLLPILLYSFSHNAIRNTLLWLIFALLWMDKYDNKIGGRTGGHKSQKTYAK